MPDDNDRDRDYPPARLAGEAPFRAEQLGDSPLAVSLDDPTRVSLHLGGRPRTVRAIHHHREFGVVADGLAPGVALDVLALDRSLSTVWDALAAVLDEMAAAGCTHTQILDYLAVEKCGWEEREWAREVRRESISWRAVDQNVRDAKRQLADEDADSDD